MKTFLRNFPVAPIPRRVWLVSVLAAGLGATALAQDLPAEAGSESPIPFVPQFHLSLLPKPLTPNPTLEMTVFTELTDFGRSFPRASREAPVYFEARDQGVQPRGFVIAGDAPLPREELNSILHRTLAADGYLPAGEGHRPSLFLVYYWGSHNRLYPDLAGMFPELAENYILERAVLVGGKTYARDFLREFIYGLVDLGVSSKKDFLRMQVRDDLYYVVVSAYTYDDLARDERRMVWRTTLTVNARGVSMGESLPPLIVTGGSYFGRETTGPLALRRSVRRGTVTLGQLYVIEDNVPLSKPPGK